MSTTETAIVEKNWKKVAQITTAYLVAAWTFLQFLDWTLVRYQISPYWVDILLWLFIGILPSLVIYLFHSDRINQKNLKLREKIIFPLNILILGVLLFLFFGNSDLGSTTKEISFTNELGNLETQVITKEEFRIGIPIFNFEQVVKDSANQWLSQTINKLIKLDLDQDKNFSPETAYATNTTAKVKMSNVFNNYYVDGEYKVENGLYTITPIIRNSKNGKEIQRKTFTGKDFFSIIDQMTIFIKSNVGLMDEMSSRYIDLEVRDITTSSMEALKYWANGNYEEAVNIDKSFALAYFYNATRRNKFSHGELEEKYLIDKAYENKSKLPSQLQFEILMYKHVVYERWDDAKELIKYQLEFEPNNDSYNYLLNIVFTETRDIDSFYEHSYKRFVKNRNETTARDYYTALLFKGEYKEALKLVKMYEILAPNTEEVQRIIAYTNLLLENYEEAKKRYKKVNLTWPQENIAKSVIDDFIERRIQGQKPKFDSEIIGSTFRSSVNEQEINYYEKEGSIFSIYKNQFLNLSFISKPKELLFINPGWASGIKHNFEKDENGNIYKLISTQFNLNKQTVFYYFKETDEMRSAFDSIKKGKIVGLDEKFEKFIKESPGHMFLRDVHQYLKYAKSKGPEALTKQFQKIVGTYGQRKFWIENNKLYYKRASLTRVELLPISETKYITLSKYESRYEFDFLKKNKIASFAWSYDNTKSAWVKLTDETNYLFKED